MKYNILFDNMERLEKKLQTIKNKCVKYGNDFTFNKLGIEYKEVEYQDGKHILKYQVVEVQGTCKVDGSWKAIATVEHAPTGNIIRQFADHENNIPSIYYSTKSICQHCNTKRKRKETIIVYNTDTQEYKQVGKSCLKDFTSIDVELYAQWVSLYDTLIQGEQVPQGYKPINYIPRNTFLTYALETIKHFSYVKTDGDFPTKERAMNYYRVDNGYIRGRLADTYRNEMNLVDFKADTEENNKTVTDAIAWIMTQDKSNSYIHNLQVVCSMEYLNYSHIGILASLIPTYQREMKRQAERQERQKQINESRQAEQESSRHVGTIGQRLNVDVSSVSVLTSFYTEYGMKYIYKIVDSNNNVLIWKTTNHLSENTKKIVATIKAHGEYREVKQTEVSRVKAIA